MIKCIRILLQTIFGNLKEKGIKYLLVAMWNTIFGIGLYSALIYIFSDKYYLLIGIITNIIAVTFAYILYKLFVFKTKGHIIAEYIRFWSVYLISSLLGIFLLYVLVDLLHIKAIIANVISTLILAAWSFIAHLFISFRHKS